MYTLIHKNWNSLCLSQSNVSKRFFTWTYLETWRSGRTCPQVSIRHLDSQYLNNKREQENRKFPDSPSG